MTILHAINDGPGYVTDRLSAAELALVRHLITAQYLDRLSQLQPDLLPLARQRGVDQYHTLPVAFDHGKSWPKATRLLDPGHVADFSRMGFFGRIRRELGPSAVISHDELNWRLVRPNQPTDVGPVHADKWFWDAGYGYGSMPAGYDRFKIWIAVHAEPGANGLAVSPSSHRSEWRHHFEVKDGVRKPVFDEDEASVGLELLALPPGGLVMFHDELLHGGVVNGGRACRVSIELTILYDRADALARMQPPRCGSLASA